MFRFICDMTCSNEQSRFVNVTKSAVTEDGQEYVVESEVIFISAFCLKLNFNVNERNE